MTDSPAARPVWLTREQRDVIDYLAATDVLESVVRQWDAAPADATEAVLRAMWPEGWLDPNDAAYRASPLRSVPTLRDAQRVLAALGAPQ